MHTRAQRTRSALLAACAAAVLSGAFALTTTSFASAQSQGSGCFVNGREVPDTIGISGTSGNDRIDCSNAPKQQAIFGGSGNDTIIGSRFNDGIRGQQGNDTISGGGGNDFLIGNAGFDSCDGGSGTDTASSCESVGAIQ